MSTCLKQSLEFLNFRLTGRSSQMGPFAKPPGDLESTVTNVRKLQAFFVQERELPAVLLL